MTNIFTEFFQKLCLQCLYNLPTKFARSRCFYLILNFKRNPALSQTKLSMSSPNTLDALIEAWNAIHPSKTLDDECLYLSLTTEATAGRRNGSSADLTIENLNTTPTQHNQPRANLPPPRRFQRRNTSHDTAPPGPAKLFDQNCFSASNVVVAVHKLDDDSDSNLAPIMASGPS